MCNPSKGTEISIAMFTVSAKVMGIISWLPGCSGQAADAVSAKSQVKMEDASTPLKIPKSECPDVWIRLPKHKWPTSWSSVEDPVVALERNLYGRPLAGLLWERQWEKVLLATRMGKFQLGNAYSSTEKKDYSCLRMWTIQKLAGKKQNIDPMWKVLMKDVDL